MVVELVVVVASEAVVGAVTRGVAIVVALLPGAMVATDACPCGNVVSLVAAVPAPGRAVGVPDGTTVLVLLVDVEEPEDELGTDVEVLDDDELGTDDGVLEDVDVSDIAVARITLKL